MIANIWSNLPKDCHRRNIECITHKVKRNSVLDARFHRSTETSVLLDVKDISILLLCFE